jgi:hypothetical protein
VELPRAGWGLPDISRYEREPGRKPGASFYARTKRLSLLLATSQDTV